MSGQKLEERHLSKIIASLNHEITRLQRRIQLINGAIANLQKAHTHAPVTLDKALKQLDKLQSNLLHDKINQKDITSLIHELEKRKEKKHERSTHAKGVAAAKIQQQTHRNVLQQLNNLRPASKQARTVPPPLPRELPRILPPPLLQSFTPTETPPALPAAFQAELEARKSPEYQAWSFKKEDYAKFIALAVASVNEFIEKQNKNNSKKFGDKGLSASSFYINLMESATTLFQKAVIIHSLLINKDKRFNDLKQSIIKKISAEMGLIDDNSFFASLQKLCPKKVNTFLHSLEKIANSNNPFTFKDTVVRQLMQLDPTPEKLLVNKHKS